MKLKKASALLLAVALCTLCIAGCGEEKNSNTSGENVTVKWESGKITAPGDLFTTPNVERSGDSAPIIAEISKQVDPGRTVTLTGCGFSGKDTKVYLYAQSEESNGKAYEITPNIVDDTTLTATVDSSVAYGVYAFYVKNENGTSNVEYVNRPKIWWNGLTAVNSGDEFSIYGENLTTKNGSESTVYLIGEGNKYMKLTPIYADPFKVTVKIPDGLEDGKEYSFKLHNGHGGEDAFADVPEKITYHKEKLAEFKGNVVNVVDFGAKPEDKNNDDTNAVIDAAASLKDGDVLYFPEGTYDIKTAIHIYNAVKVKGDGSKKTNIILNSSFAENSALFNFTYGPVEVTGIAFKDIRKGKLSNYFIHFKDGTGTEGDVCNLNVNNCYFAQNTRTTSRSSVDCIFAGNTSGVVIKNNNFEATAMLQCNGNNKIFINDNIYYGTCFVGNYYGQNVGTLWNNNGFDGSNNQFYGRDIVNDDSGYLKKDDYTTGRIFAFQQVNRNLYIANNKMERTGAPTDNSGEQIMLENVTNRYLGGITAADENSVTLEGMEKTISKNYIVTVVSGKGVTQWRYVKSLKGKKIEVSEPWDIVPDSTSTVMVSGCFDNVAMYNNDLNCFKNYNEDGHTATCALQVYGNTHNLFMKKNTVKNVNTAVCITSHYLPNKNGGGEANGVYWSYFDDNIISESACAITLKLAAVEGSSGKIPMHTSFGVSIRNNTIKDINDYKYDNRKGLGGVGIEIGTPRVTYNGWADSETWLGPWQFAAVIENNTFENCALNNILMCKHQSGMILLNNKVLGGPVKDLITYEVNAEKPLVNK